MKKARLRLTTVCDGQRVTVLLEYPSLADLSRALRNAMPLLRAYGGKVPQKAIGEQLALIPNVNQTHADSREAAGRVV
jgi:hypothetical protein